MQAPVSCAYIGSPNTLSVLSSADSPSVSVLSNTGCTWSASSSAGFVTITSGSPVTGNGTVALSVAANTGSTPRSAVLSIAGHTVVLTQDGTCAYTLGPSSASAGIA